MVDLLLMFDFILRAKGGVVGYPLHDRLRFRNRLRRSIARPLHMDFVAPLNHAVVVNCEINAHQRGNQRARDG